MNESHPELCQAIAHRIRAHPNQRIPFSEFMDLALYHPQSGYYVTRALKIGAGGDFFTSPHLGSDFGELLAEQFANCWEILQRPHPFNLVEMGAGQGILARDILTYLRQHYPDCLAALTYQIVERSATLRTVQQQHLKSLMEEGTGVQWCALEEIPPDSITGCYFSNELVDAFPVHLVELHQGQLQEVYVTLAEDRTDRPEFREVLGELSDPRLGEYFPLVGIELSGDRYPDGYRTEINLAALDWISTVAAQLHQGYLLTIDYGYPASRYYSPTRTQGTLQAYYQHTHHNDPYQHIGLQDLTAHVDFTALERQGDRCGLHSLGLTQQGLFLMALGMGDRIAALSTSEGPTTANSLQTLLQRREALRSLINPMGLGNFGVLIQAKGLTSAEQEHPLKGLTIPPLNTL